MAPTNRQAAVMASPKAAALYYERIFPIPAREEDVMETQELLDFPEQEVTNILVDLSITECRSMLGSITQVLDRIRRGELSGDPVSDDGFRWANLLEKTLYESSVACNMCIDKELVLAEIPISTREGEGIHVDSASALVRLMNLNLVDVRGASWRQIVEFRRDEDAKIAFARLRDFLFTSCANLSPEGLDDRFSSIIDDYNLKSSEHGLKVKRAAIDVVLNSQQFLKLAGAGILSMLCQQADPQILSQMAAPLLAGTSIVIDCTRAAIASYAALKEKRTALRQHPANWVFLAKNSLVAPSMIQN